MACVLALLAVATAAERDLPKGWQAPQGWAVEGSAQGDLDGDGRPDLAVVLHGVSDAVKLQVYLQQPDGSWRLHTEAPKAVCFQCGGPKGLPVEGDPAITPRGILEMRYSGGSRDAWDVVAKWRLDGSGHFTLIGYTIKNYDTLSPQGEMEPGEISSKDANLSTLQMVERISGRKALLECHLPAKLRGVELSRFSFEDFDLGDCRKVR